MSDVHLVGSLEFAAPARRQEGLAAFDAGRYTEFTALEDWIPVGSKGLRIDATHEVEADCIDHYHEALVALAKSARSGRVELRWAPREGHWGVVWAGGHYLEVEPPPAPGPLRSLSPRRLMRRYVEWPGKVAQRWKDDVRFSACAVSRDGGLLVAAGGPPAKPFVRTGPDLGQYRLRAHWGVACFDVATGQEKWRSFAANGVVGALCFSADGAHVFAGSADGHLHVLDAATGAQVHGEKKALVGGFAAIACSPDGSVVAAAGRAAKVGFRDAGTSKQALRLWRLPDWKPWKPRGTGAEFAAVFGLAFSRDGEHLTVWRMPGGSQPVALVLPLGAGPARKPTPLPEDGWDLQGECVVRAGT